MQRGKRKLKDSRRFQVRIKQLIKDHPILKVYDTQKTTQREPLKRIIEREERIAGEKNIKEEDFN
ncbi:hypothetical protein ACSAZL_04725 [Methanosarcina sp. T3]|uniref:hypothetical protein n=1 Tax=Methanosarcina sp. T3 TaxID=3439062 RepID=UPI003F833B27